MQAIKERKKVDYLNRYAIRFKAEHPGCTVKRDHKSSVRGINVDILAITGKTAPRSENGQGSRSDRCVWADLIVLYRGLMCGREGADALFRTWEAGTFGALYRVSNGVYLRCVPRKLYILSNAPLPAAFANRLDALVSDMEEHPFLINGVKVRFHYEVIVDIECPV